MIRLQDDRALRLALAARPRVVEEFQPGALVAYYRNQKWVQGKLVLGGKWYGTAVVLGKIGRNYVIAHRKQILRVAPEQLRAATKEEQTLITTPQVELLGIKDLIEGGTFQSKQFLDLTQQAYPVVEPSVPILPSTESTESEESRVESVPEPGQSEGPPPLVSPEVPFPVEATATSPVAEMNSVNPADTSDLSVAESLEPPELETYGPITQRLRSKNGPDALGRPAPMHADDFVSIMREVTPELISNLLQSEDSSQSMDTAESGHKRSTPASPLDSAAEPSTSRMRTQSPSTEVLSAEWLDTCPDTETLVAEYLKHKASKEIPHSNNPPDIQKKVDLGKRLEWETISSRPNIVKVHYGKAAENIRKTLDHRFIGSRYVLTRKPLDDGVPIVPSDPSTYTVKGRWCLQGHLDPDLSEKASEGKLQSPTLNQLSRMMVMQIISSFGWDLQLRDIKSAFLESGLIEEKYRPLYARQPPGGIPGLPSDAVIEILGNLYGQNTAPAMWFETFRNAAIEGGWTQSKYDSCLFTLRSAQDQSLIGIMGVHVDDTALGGAGEEFKAAVTRLREKFPYRKWRIGSGDFCGAFYTQCPKTKAIHMSMKDCASKMRPANIKKGVSPETPLDEYQTRTLRGINGSLNWLSTQSRPDLAAQTSISQQAFPHPKIKHLRHANNVVRRARMHSDLRITFKPIDPQRLTIVCHSDAAFANIGVHTQAGYIIGFTDQSLQDGAVAPWCPVTWKSHRLSRAVSSTLAAESQSLSIATGTCEWILLVLSEILDGPCFMRDCREKLSVRKAIVVTDCKSLFDHLFSPSAPTAIEDRRTSIDVAIIRESLRAMQAHLRWAPTDRMLADALTKDLGDPLDLLRSCFKSAEYQISPEDHVLRTQAKEREDRMRKKQSESQDAKPSVSQ